MVRHFLLPTSTTAVSETDSSSDHGAAPEVLDIFDDANGELAVGDLEAAVIKYRRCVELEPKFFDGWHALGMALMKTDQLKEAIGAGLMATNLKPNDLLAWTGLSQMYVKNGQIAEAEDAKGNARILSLGGRVVK
ncbi:MAG: Flp pilus assembly protein TadD [Verrucomicrobiales bacterium]|jgi:Flp pilus assembly protein TadD